MMRANTTDTFSELTQALSRQDRSLLVRMLEECPDVVIFGSRAAGVHSRSSDLDILCVGTSLRRKQGQLDIVSRTVAEVENQKWLGSELASHIVTYGVVIGGRADWKDAVRLAGLAVSQKERRLVALVDGLWAHWSRLHPDFRRKYLTTIRRETQRLKVLGEGIAVPPTPVLDRNWNAECADSEQWVRCLRDIKIGNAAARDRILRTTDLIYRRAVLCGISKNDSTRVAKFEGPV
jgi:predicted nucleotidyltransferase